MMSQTTAWIYLALAGLLEIIWAIGLKYTHGFTKFVPSVFTVLAMVASMYLLGRSASVIPIGTAYGVWVGIGVVGASILGILLFKEPATTPRILFLLMLVVSIVGLKLTFRSP
jgi:quaternary ammonium compound-resistance protein SugE